MTLVRSTDHDDYRPAHGTLLVEDHWDWDVGPALPDDATTDEDKDEDEREDLPDPLSDDLTLGDVNAFTSAGCGWLRASTRYASHLLRLELHDGEPEDDLETWAEAARTPYLSRTGMVAPGMVAGGAEPEFALTLNGPGSYLVRVCVRPRAQEPADLGPVDPGEPCTGDERTWRLQFWPTRDPSPLPSRLLREAAVGNGRASWDELFPSLNQLVNAWVSTGQGGFLDGSPVDPAAPVDPTPDPPAPTGDAASDADRSNNFRRYLARQQENHDRWNGLARRLGLPPADTVGGAQQLLLTVGMLNDVGGDEQTRYRLTVPSTDPRDLLTLTAEERAALSTGDRRQRVGTLLDDVVAFARWAQAGGAAEGVDGIAEHVLAPAHLVREALELAVEDRRLAVVPGIADDGTTDDVPLRLVVLPDPSLAPNAGHRHPVEPDEPDEDPDESVVALVATAQELAARAVVTGGAAWDGEVCLPPKELAVGAPARAGYLMADGRVVVPRDGRLHVLAVVPEGLRAWQLADGVLVQTAGMPVIVGSDGTVRPIEVPVPPDSLLEPVVSPDGRRVYLASWQYGRHDRGLHRVFRVDLPEATVTDLDWPAHELPAISAVVTGEFGGDTLFLEGLPDSLRWQPPAPPERVPGSVIDVDGSSRALLVRGPEGPVAQRPDGAVVPLPVEVTAIVPGGGAAVDYRFEADQYTIVFVPLGESAGEPRTAQFDVGPTALANDQTVVWEDAERVVVPSPELVLSHAVRLDLSTSRAERLALPGGAPIGWVITPLPCP